MENNQEEINIGLLIEQSNKESEAMKNEKHPKMGWLNATIIIGLLCFILGCIMFDKLAGRDVDVVKTDTITIVRIDTMFVDRPTEVVRYVTRLDTIKINDVVYITDTTGTPSIILPIEQAIYKDSTDKAAYEAYVSGYKAALDSIHIFCNSTETIITKIEREKARRFGAGVQCGIGISAQGMAVPYIGFGIQYRLFGK